MRITRVRRRRAVSTRTYSIAYLLSRQPKGLRRHDQYATMVSHFKASERLKTLRVGQRCYSLLNKARIAPDNLHHFYRTYRLPADPFFPLFFAIKGAYLAERERTKEERHKYILARVRSLPEPILTFFRYLGELECHYNGSGRSPVWQQHLFPSSKKQADAYARYGMADWHTILRDHLSRLAARYPGMTDVVVARVLGSFLLELPPNGVPPARPSRRQISRNYRRLSLVHHPDRGGDARLFILIKRARDVLVGGE